MSLRLFLSFGTSVNAQNNKDILKMITDKIKSLYPDASKGNWEKEDGIYEGSFSIRMKESSLVFSRDTILLQTETEIKIAVLPEPALHYRVEPYGDNKTDEASIFEDEKGINTFEPKAEQMEYTFDFTG